MEAHGCHWPAAYLMRHNKISRGRAQPQPQGCSVLPPHAWVASRHASIARARARHASRRRPGPLPTRPSPQGPYRAYQLQTADLTCSSLGELTVYNIRRLFVSLLRAVQRGRSASSIQWERAHRRQEVGAAGCGAVCRSCRGRSLCLGRPSKTSFVSGDPEWRPGLMPSAPPPQPRPPTPGQPWPGDDGRGEGGGPRAMGLGAAPPQPPEAGHRDGAPLRLKGSFASA
jgi:hypothetical protein